MTTLILNLIIIAVASILLVAARNRLKPSAFKLKRATEKISQSSPNFNSLLWSVATFLLLLMLMGKIKNGEDGSEYIALIIALVTLNYRQKIND